MSDETHRQICTQLISALTYKYKVAEIYLSSTQDTQEIKEMLLESLHYIVTELERCSRDILDSPEIRIAYVQHEIKSLTQLLNQHQSLEVQCYIYQCLSDAFLCMHDLQSHCVKPLKSEA